MQCSVGEGRKRFTKLRRTKPITPLRDSDFSDSSLGDVGPHFHLLILSD